MYSEQERVNDINADAFYHARCDVCPLFQEHIKPLCGSGNPAANIVLVADAPSLLDSKRGTAFNGTIGTIIKATMQNADIAEDTVWRTHTVLCPSTNIDGKNTPPPQAAINACKPRLEIELELVKPQITLLMGAGPAKALYDKREGITKLVGAMRWSDQYNTWLIPTYNPTSVLAGQVDNYDVIYDAFRRASRFVSGDVPFPAKDREEQPFVYAETEQEAFRALSAMSQYRTLSLDIETENTNFLLDALLVVAFAAPDGKAWVIDGEALKGPSTGPYFRRLLESDRIEWILHNSAFDVGFLRYHYGVGPKRITDTMALALATTEKGNQVGLKYLSRLWLNADHYETDLRDYLPAETSKTRADWSQIPRDILATYAAKDVRYTVQLPTILKKLAEEDGTTALYEQILMPSQRMFTNWHYRGIRIDTAQAKAVEEAWTPVVDNARQSVQDYATSVGFRLQDYIPQPERMTALQAQKYVELVSHLNPNSPPQLAKLIYDHLGMKPPAGKRTTGKTFLDANADHPLVERLSHYRQMYRVLNTYARGIIEDIWPDGRIHPDYLLFGTVTGRIVINNPELQTIPHYGVNAELVKFIRKLFLPTEGYTWLSADYSQLEIRVAAHFSQDKNLIAAINSGDFHTAVARRIYHLPDDIKPTGEQRTNAKRTSFGVMYGIGPTLLASHLGISQQEADRLITTFYRQFPDYKRFTDEIIARALREGELTTPTGRKRRWSIITQDTRKHMLNQAVNFPIQSLGSDMCLSAAIRVDEVFRERGLGHVLFTIHDSLEMEVKSDKVMEAARVVEDIMMHPPFESRIEFPAEIAAGPTWADTVVLDVARSR